VSRINEIPSCGRRHADFSDALHLFSLIDCGSPAQLADSVRLCPHDTEANPASSPRSPAKPLRRCLISAVPCLHPLRAPCQGRRGLALSRLVNRPDSIGHKSPLVGERGRCPSLPQQEPPRPSGAAIPSHPEGCNRVAHHRAACPHAPPRILPPLSPAVPHVLGDRSGVLLPAGQEGRCAFERRQRK
jgi:hypothetical protein